MKRNQKLNVGKVKTVLFKVFLILLVMFPITNVVSKAALSSVNLDVERTKRQIKIQENKNESLTMKVNELKSMANLQSVIDSEGLSYDSSKIKVIAIANN